MTYYAVLLPMLDEQKSEDYREAHVAYLQEKKAEGKIFANGRFIDGTGGLVIYQTNTFEELLELVQNDPYVVERARDFEIHEWDLVM
ncbi:YciI family protein [Shouchella sp. 1P09AA]|uniref:YciI family protein n=1 Tax=unclassified Shouchella TaxID=2893065 RepID=UPI0039A281B7